MFPRNDSTLFGHANDDRIRGEMIPPGMSLPPGSFDNPRESDGDVVMVDTFGEDVSRPFPIYDPGLFSAPPRLPYLPLDLRSEVPIAENCMVPSALHAPGVRGHMPNVTPVPDGNFSTLSEIRCNGARKFTSVATNLNRSGWGPRSHLDTDVLLLNLHRGKMVLDVKLCCLELLEAFPTLRPRVYFPSRGEHFLFRGQSEGDDDEETDSEFFLNFRAEITIRSRGVLSHSSTRFFCPEFISPRLSVPRRPQLVEVEEEEGEGKQRVIRNDPLDRPLASSYCSSIPSVQFLSSSSSSSDHHLLDYVRFILRLDQLFPPPGSLLIAELSLIAEIPNFESNRINEIIPVGKVTTQWWMKKSNQKTDCESSRSEQRPFVLVKNSSFFSNVCLQHMNTLASVLAPPPPPPSVSYPTTVPVPIQIPPLADDFFPTRMMMGPEDGFLLADGNGFDFGNDDGMDVDDVDEDEDNVVGAGLDIWSEFGRFGGFGDDSPMIHDDFFSNDDDGFYLI